MRRLTAEELFRVGPDGLEPISDETLELRIEAAQQLARQRAQYELREVLGIIAQAPTLSQQDPLETV